MRYLILIVSIINLTGNAAHQHPLSSNRIKSLKIFGSALAKTQDSNESAEFPRHMREILNLEKVNYELKSH